MSLKNLKSLFFLFVCSFVWEGIRCFDWYVRNCSGDNALMDSACEDMLCGMVEEI